MLNEGLASTIGGRPSVGVSIVMPCLNEVDCLPACIANARAALDLIEQKFGLTGEIVIADNGSSDGSQTVAEGLDARCVDVPRRGYGAALSGGFMAARGRYLVMGDADGSYDFRDSVAMVGKLIEGADLCMGSRFKGGIEPRAMPWKNRYIGNPVLTGILNLLFRSGISDAHCGLRALTRDCFDRLGLSGSGMEFASEMVIKASLLGVRIVEVPAKLRRDLRNRPPHLRPWRDGWRHLRYLLMLSPVWLFALPAAVLAALSMTILGAAGLAALQGTAATSFFGNFWVILAGGLASVSHIAALLAVAGKLYGIRQGYRRTGTRVQALAGLVSLESMLIVGVISMMLGLGLLSYLLIYWSAHHFDPIANVLPAVLGTSLMVIGMQNMLGGFLLSIISGNDANFMKAPAPALSPPATPAAGEAQRPSRAA